MSPYLSTNKTIRKVLKRTKTKEEVVPTISVRRAYLDFIPPSDERQTMPVSQKVSLIGTCNNSPSTFNKKRNAITSVKSSFSKRCTEDSDNNDQLTKPLVMENDCEYLSSITPESELKIKVM